MQRALEERTFYGFCKVILRHFVRWNGIGAIWSH